MKEALKDPKYAKLELLDVVYGNDQSETSYNQALALVDKYPDMKLIMAPTTVGIAAAAKAMQDEKLCDKVKVSGLGLPAEMVSYTKNGCAPEFALWSFVDLGYLTYYATYLLATGALKGEEGEKFEAGRMGEYTIEKDPTRDNGLRVLMGPFTVYNKDNVDKEAGPAAGRRRRCSGEGDPGPGRADDRCCRSSWASWSSIRPTRARRKPPRNSRTRPSWSSSAPRRRTASPARSRS